MSSSNEKWSAHQVGSTRSVNLTSPLSKMELEMLVV